VLIGDCDRRVTNEWRMSTKELEQYATGRVDIGASVNCLATRLLR
jgi:hypothetical protein